MRSPSRLLRDLWRHPWRNWGLLLYAGGLTAVVRVALSVVPLRRLTRALRRVASWLPHWTRSTPQYRLRAAWAAHAVGRRLLPERPCLTQALVLQYLLLRRGDDTAELHIGVTKSDDEGLQAHAWVERDGQVLIGGTNAPTRYKRFEDLKAKMERVNAPEQS